MRVEGWELEAGGWIVGIGCWVLDTGCGILDTGCCILDAGCGVLGGRCGRVGSGWGLLFAEDFEDDLGGDAVGVIAVGEDALWGAAPASAAKEFPGVQSGIAEQRVPVGLRRCRRQMRTGVRRR